ncbi:unnamed protein product [Eruca vesicaria subsp. sativa]|uniref:LOB domain-containing protein n=1 Tax=Eruca vesicaria subsp. sativa TaxID=29727 RepID=A0ABC8JBZ4_ERUVS|nr:unnamed protein product [Eruca vesicaria subsp. sativa]
MELCDTCKEARQECTHECMLATPYMRSNKPEKYSDLSKMFGMRNVVRILKEVDPSQSQACVDSLCFEAEAHIRDPVYGTVGIIHLLQCRLQDIKLSLEISKKELVKIGHGQNHQPPNGSSRL